jgi:hypothetical protein
MMLTVLAVDHGEPADALNYSSVSIRHQYDAGNFFLVTNSLAALAVLLDRLGYPRAAATIGGYAESPFNRSAYAEFGVATAHLREQLGDEAYESLARAGEQMTTAEMVAFAFDQMDCARAALT